MSLEPAFHLRESFIIRIWRSDELTDLWRGQLQHVRTGETIPVADLKNISAEIEAYLKKVERSDRGLN